MQINFTWKWKMHTIYSNVLRKNPNLDPNFKKYCTTAIFKSNKTENISNLPKYIQYDCESEFLKKWS